MFRMYFCFSAYDINENGRTLLKKNEWYEYFEGIGNLIPYTCTWSMLFNYICMRKKNKIKHIKIK